MFEKKEKKTKKSKKKKKSAVKSKGFSASDFRVKAVAGHTLVWVDDATNLNTTVAFGTSSTTLTERISTTFSPASGLSSIDIASGSVSGVLAADTAHFGTVSAAGGFPITLTNDGVGNSQVATIGVIYDNQTWLNLNDQVENVRLNVSLNNASLYATATGDTINPAASGLRSSSFAALTAAGSQATYDVTPQLTAADASVAYGASGTYTGTATFAASSLAGAGTGVSSVDIVNIYLSGPDTSNFSTVSADITLPSLTVTPRLITFNTTFNNNRLHASTELVTINAVVSTANAALSSGWIGTFTPATEEFSAGTYTVTALGDAGAPSGIQNFRVRNRINANRLSWTDPNSDLSAVQIMFCTTSAPSARSEGTLVGIVAAPTTYTTHSPLTSYVPHYYSAFSQDNVGKWSTTPVSGYNTPIRNTINGAFDYETTEMTLSRYVVEGII